MNRILCASAIAIALLSCRTTEDLRIDSSRPNRSFRFVYQASVDAVPATAENTRLWIPLPLDTTDQRIANVELVIHGEDRELFRAFANDSSGLQRGSGAGVSWVANAIDGGEGRSLCIETPGEPVSVEVCYDVTRYETTGGGGSNPEELDQLLTPDAMIPLDGKVAAIATGMKVGSDPMVAGRQLYDHTLERMRYDKPAGGAWGRGDAEWACDSRHGNCTDFHSYFMGLARAKGIPVRFEMGFSVVDGDEPEAKVGGYHCWSFFWAGERGWVPVDISEADKHPAKRDYFFGTLDYDRFTMTGGRDLTLDPAPAIGTLNFFVYPYAEVDGKMWHEVSKSFKRIRLDG